MGATTKFHVLYDRAFWRDNGFSRNLRERYVSVAVSPQWTFRALSPHTSTRSFVDSSKCLFHRQNLVEPLEKQVEDLTVEVDASALSHDVQRLGQGESLAVDPVCA